MIDNILVSVIVISYNSENYIIETLESIKKQTYKNIELIVSDDSSTDNTISNSKKWFSENKDRFQDYKIIESDVNTGITENCNRGIYAAKGEYIKLIAADDLLMLDCIDSMLNFTVENGLKISFSRTLPFADDANINISSKLVMVENVISDKFFKLDQKEQYKMLLKGCGIYAAGVFFNRDFILSIGGFDSRYKMMEDYPLWVKVSSLGERFVMLDKYTTKYRVRNMDKQENFKKSKRCTMHFDNLCCFEKDEIIPKLKEKKMYIAIYDIHVKRFSNMIRINASNSIWIFISKIISYFSISRIKFKIDYLLVANKKIMIKFDTRR